MKLVYDFDVLKIFHFIGARRKRHYMYKWISVRNGELFALHLEDNKGCGFYLFPHTGPTGIFDGEIVQTRYDASGWEKK